MTFLPLLNEPCSFDLLIYTSQAAVVPKKWEDSDPRYIMNSREVKLRSFTTSVSGPRARRGMTDCGRDERGVIPKRCCESGA